MAAWTNGTYSTDSCTITTGISTSSEYFRQEQLRMMLEQAREQGKREGITNYYTDRHRRPSIDHEWSDYEQQWVLRGHRSYEAPKVTKKQSFFEKLQAEVDDWIKDVEVLV